MADYLRPTSLDDVLAAQPDRPWTMFVGGTDVYPANVGRPIADDILDVTELPSLRSIAIEDGVVRIPAFGDLDAPGPAGAPPGIDGLKAAARSIGGVQIQAPGGQS